jgi:hypothetical protein
MARVELDDEIIAHAETFHGEVFDLEPSARREMFLIRKTVRRPISCGSRKPTKKSQQLIKLIQPSYLSNALRGELQIVKTAIDIVKWKIMIIKEQHSARQLFARWRGQ